MNDRVTKNYFKDGGDTLVIGGKLIVEEDAEVEGLDTGGSGDLPVATKHDLGGVRVGTGLNISASGTLSAAPATPTMVGAVKKLPYMADFDETSFLSFEEHFNQLLAAMREAGMMEASE